MANSPDTRTIVVGIDHSPAALEALRWASGEACVRRTNLRLVHAVDPAFAGYGSPMLGAAALFSAADCDRRMLDDLAATECEGIEVSVAVPFGRAGAELVREAADVDAAMLVVGSSGGGVWRDMLGSTSAYCVRHGRSPVVVVHEDQRSVA